MFNNTLSNNILLSNNKLRLCQLHILETKLSLKIYLLTDFFLLNSQHQNLNLLVKFRYICILDLHLMQ